MSYFQLELESVERELRTPITNQRRRELNNRLPYLQRQAAAEQQAEEQLRRLQAMTHDRR